MFWAFTLEKFHEAMHVQPLEMEGCDPDAFRLSATRAMYCQPLGWFGTLYSLTLYFLVVIYVIRYSHSRTLSKSNMRKLKVKIAAIRNRAKKEIIFPICITETSLVSIC